MMKTAADTARDMIGADALAGVGYERDLQIAERAITYDRTRRGVGVMLGSSADLSPRMMISKHH